MSNRFTYNIDALTFLPDRPTRSNKGTFGQVLVVGGCVGMSGAAYFSAKAAYRSGAGLVRILAPNENRIIYQTQLPEAVLTLYDSTEPDEKVVKNAVCRATVTVLGVGLGMSPVSARILRWTLEACSSPLILDADGLNLLAADASLLKLLPENTIITPHAVEMSRLSGLDTQTILNDIPATAEQFAKTHNVICVMKDSATAVSDGTQTMINSSGNSGMATGGSGDVLTGIIAALSAQGMSPFDSAALGVYIHGLAGDEASHELSEYSVTASDIIDSLPKIFNRKNNHQSLGENN